MTANGTSKNVFLIWGGNGWIASHLQELLSRQGKKVYTTTTRMEDRESVLEELKRVKPTHVLNCAGCTGRPNVDWCEDNRESTIRSNAIGTINLTDCCFLLGIHITVFATGCMFSSSSLSMAAARQNEAFRWGPDVTQVYTNMTTRIPSAVKDTSRRTRPISTARSTLQRSQEWKR